MTHPVADAGGPSLGGQWSLGEEAFATLVEDARQVAVTQVVEFGAGASSYRLAQAFPDADVLSLEHDRGFYEKHLLWKAKYPTPNLRIVHRPLAWQMHGLAAYYSYQPEAFPTRVDVVLIDGPPLWTQLGREACFYQILPHLRVGSRVYLDDSARESERRILANWSRRTGTALRFRTLEVGHTITVVEIVSPVVPRLSAQAIVGSYRRAARVQRIRAERAGRKLARRVLDHLQVRGAGPFSRK